MLLQRAEDIERLKPAATTQIESSRAEPGCLEYTYAVDLLEPSKIRVTERWTSWAALEAHFKMPHMAVWREALRDLEIVARHLKAHEVKDSRTI